MGEKGWFGEYYDKNHDRINIGTHILLEAKPALEKMVLDMLAGIQGLPQ